MKKTLFFTLLVTSIFVNAQITTSSPNVVEEAEFNNDLKIIKLNTDGYKIVIEEVEGGGIPVDSPVKNEEEKSSPEHKIKLYNFDGTIYKTIDLTNFNVTGGFSIVNISQNIVNTDNKIELMVEKGTTDAATGGSGITGFMIINEDLQTLFEIDNYSPYFSDNGSTGAPGMQKLITGKYNTYKTHFLQQTNNGVKLLLENRVSDTSGNNTVSIKVFKLGGTASLNKTAVKPTEIATKIYPNPSSNSFNLEYKLPNGITNGTVHIYNINGNLVKQFSVTKNTNSLKVTNHNLASGIYLYKVFAKKYTSKARKLIIK